MPLQLGLGLLQLLSRQIIPKPLAVPTLLHELVDSLVG
jgi:hypothetical protein